MEFYEILRNIRKITNKSAREVAKESGISYDNLCRYERGECEPNIKNLIFLAKNYHVSLDYLLTGKETEENYIFYEEYKEIKSTKKSIDQMYRTLDAVMQRSSVMNKGE